MDLTSLLVYVVSGIVGGNAGGFLAKARSLGPVVNSVLGALGGLAGGALLAPQVGTGTATEAGIAVIVGALLPLVAGYLKKSK